MKKARKSTPKRKRDLFLGTRFNPDDAASQVEFTVSRAGEAYAVQARDRFDGEAADIFETAWDGDVLTFAAHWNSIGRFARYRIFLFSANRIEVTYTYTDHERYDRKPARRNAQSVVSSAAPLDSRANRERPLPPERVPGRGR